MRFARVTFVSPVEDPAKPTSIHKREFSTPEYVLELGVAGCLITHAASGEQRATNVPFFGTPLKDEEPSYVQAARADGLDSLADVAMHAVKQDEAASAQDRHALWGDVTAVPSEPTTVGKKPRKGKPGSVA